MGEQSLVVRVVGAPHDAVDADLVARRDVVGSSSSDVPTWTLRRKYSDGVSLRAVRPRGGSAGTPAALRRLAMRHSPSSGASSRSDPGAAGLGEHELAGRGSARTRHRASGGHSPHLEERCGLVRAHRGGGRPRPRSRGGPTAIEWRCTGICSSRTPPRTGRGGVRRGSRAGTCGRTGSARPSGRASFAQRTSAIASSTSLRNTCASPARRPGAWAQKSTSQRLWACTPAQR